MTERLMGGPGLLRRQLDRGELVVAVGAHDALSALLVQATGFDAAYLGSFATHATFLGMPDMSLMSKTDLLMLTRNITKVLSIPLIVDVEEGYGNFVSVMDTVRDFEAVGVAGLHIDDQSIPGKCPFIPGVGPSTLTSVDEMCEKIRAAVEARTDPRLMIIARCDVISTVPVEEYRRQGLAQQVAERSRAYVDAGADAIFVMALDDNELRYFRAEISAPLVGVFAPLEPLSIRQFADAGYQMTIGSVASLYMSTRGLVDGLRSLKATGDWKAIPDKLIGRDELLELLGLPKYREIYERYSGDGGAGSLLPENARGE